MSRLYEALKGAGQIQAGGQAADSIWEALDAAELPPVTEVEPRTDLKAIPETDSEEPIAAFDAPAAEAIHTGGTRAPARTCLDPQARLVPHALDSSVIERYRRLRTKLIQQQNEKPFRSLLVTSANAQEGKTLTVLNLGLTFAMLPSCRVLIVDGDLRKGTMGQWLGVSDGRYAGLSNLIDGSATLDDVLLKAEDVPVHVVVRGNATIPTDIHSSAIIPHIRRMAERFDLVIVDSPPVNLIADVQLLAEGCDAVLLVARAFSTTRKTLEKAAQELQRFRVIGTVLNAGTVPRSRYYGYSH